MSCPLPRIRGSICLLAVALATGGCLSFAERVGDHLAERSLDLERAVFVVEGDLALFRQCLARRGGLCEGATATPLPQAANAGATIEPVRAELGQGTSDGITALPDRHPAKLAEQTLKHPFLGKAVSFHNYLRGHDVTDRSGFRIQSDAATQTSTVHLETSIGETRGFFSLLHRSLSAGSWDALEAHTGRQLERETPGTQGHTAAARDHRTATFVKGYLAAYFRNGHFIEVDYKVDRDLAIADLAKELEESFSTLCGGDDCTDVATKLFDALAADSGLLGDHTLLKASSTGWVSRDGSSQAMFPTFQVDLNLVGSPHVSISAQDTTGSATNSTRSVLGSVGFTTVGTDIVRIFLEAVFDAHESLPATVATATGLTLGEGYALPRFDPSTGDVSAEDLATIGRVNGQITAGTEAITQRLVGGVGPFSLNNQALEDLITATVTTSVKKAVEKATWCWFACDLDLAVENAVKAGEAEVQGFVHAEAEHVKLRLKLDGKTD